jgi:Na+-driven multidrug efflux pump
MVLLLPMFGVIQGMMPIVGYSYGAGLMQRARQVVRLSIWITSTFSILVSALLLLFPQGFMRIFTPDPSVVSLGARAIGVVVIALPTVGFQIVAGGMYQALGHALPAFILAVLRQVILLIPLVVILPRFMGLAGVWTSFPISDGTAAVVTAVMLTRLLKAFRAGIDPRASVRPVDPAE